jgi:polyhydroxyalkanoate synthase
LPVDVLQTLFATFDPDLTVRKYSAFLDLPKRSAAARNFAMAEDWANDGGPLAAEVARESLHGWYMNNTPPKGEWLVAGQAVRPEKIKIPTMVIVPERDRIVTPSSALALCHALKDVTPLQVAGGHVGMLMGRRVGSALHAPIARHMKKWAGK